MPLLVPSASTFGSVGDTAIVQYQVTAGRVGVTAGATVTAGAAVEEVDLEMSPTAPSTITNAAITVTTTTHLRAKSFFTAPPRSVTTPGAPLSSSSS